MGLEEESLNRVNNKVKKTKEKSKKGKKDAMIGDRISEPENVSRDGVSNDGSSSENKNGEKGNVEKKKKKKQKVESRLETKESDDGYVKRVGNDSKKESEVCKQKNHDGNGLEKVKKKKKKKEIDKSGVSDQQLLEQSLEDVGGGSMGGEQYNDLPNRSSGHDLENVEEGEKKRKRKKDKSVVSEDKVDGIRELHVNERGQDELLEEINIGAVAEDDLGMKYEKKRKKKRDKKEGDIGSGAGTTMPLELDRHMNDDKKGEKKKSKLVENRKGKNKVSFSGEDEVFTLSEENDRGQDESLKEITEDDVGMKDEKKRKKKRKKREGDIGSGADTTMTSELDSNMNGEKNRKKKKAKSVENEPEDPKTRKGKKKVRFSGEDEVFTLPEPAPAPEPEPEPEENLVRGKRFSAEEDEMVRAAVYQYIEANGLGEEGLDMVLNCRSNPKTRNCWKEIATALPHRPQSSIYFRAHVLFRRDEKRKWTKEELDQLRELHKLHGNNWKAIADELGKYRYHVKDTWRNIRHENMKHGKWSQEEYQSLFDLVNLDLRMKYFEEKKSKYGMLRDNIPWTAISDKLTTRAEPACCYKWYFRLTSPMVEEKIWLDSDDYRLLDALYELDATCYDDVDWDSLLEHRSGEVCQRRWKEMVRHIGDSRKKSFPDQVEVLTKRYCPELLEARENWENKPYVP